MKNTIAVNVEFYFKGERFTPSMVVDLDDFIKSNSGLEPLYAMLAISNGIDLYSYEYEMMQVEKLVFSDAGGLAAAFIDDGDFDFKGFGRALNDERIDGVLSAIASSRLSVDDLGSRPDLRAALLEAYVLGRKSAG